MSEAAVLQRLCELVAELSRIVKATDTEGSYYAVLIDISREAEALREQIGDE